MLKLPGPASSYEDGLNKVHGILDHKTNLVSHTPAWQPVHVWPHSIRGAWKSHTDNPCNANDWARQTEHGHAWRTGRSAFRYIVSSGAPHVWCFPSTVHGKLSRFSNMSFAESNLAKSSFSHACTQIEAQFREGCASRRACLWSRHDRNMGVSDMSHGHVICFGIHFGEDKHGVSYIVWEAPNKAKSCILWRVAAAYCSNPRCHSSHILIAQTEGSSFQNN